ncbi:MAG: hypothetical protein JXR68_02675 [Bacteroidales bacterium]|nr:hypothetical protein [Bacteroidales bacterium]
MGNKLSFKNYLFVVIKFIIWGIFTFSFMVIISHFSVYKDKPNYKFSDSLQALLFKTDVPAEFFLYFGILIILVLFFALLLKFITGKPYEKSA